MLRIGTIITVKIGTFWHQKFLDDYEIKGRKAVSK